MDGFRTLIAIYYTAQNKPGLEENFQARFRMTYICV